VRASRPAEGGRRGASLLFPDGHFPLGIPAYLTIMSRRQGPIRAVGGGGADEGLRTGVMLTARRALMLLSSI
jgi:hypothetical protein